MESSKTSKDKLNIKERKLKLTKRKKKRAGEIFKSLKFFLLRPFPRLFLLKMSYVRVGARGCDEDMTLLLDCDVLQAEHEGDSDYNNYLDDKRDKENRSKVINMSEDCIWKHVLEYFCPSYVLARDIENYIPDSIAFHEGELDNVILQEASETAEE